jgi:hypothetical protein
MKLLKLETARYFEVMLRQTLNHYVEFRNYMHYADQLLPEFLVVIVMCFVANFTQV